MGNVQPLRKRSAASRKRTKAKPETGERNSKSSQRGCLPLFRSRNCKTLFAPGGKKPIAALVALRVSRRDDLGTSLRLQVPPLTQRATTVLFLEARCIAADVVRLVTGDDTGYATEHGSPDFISPASGV